MDASRDDPSRLVVDHEQRNGGTIVAVTGDVDLATAQTLRDALEEPRAQSASLVLDMTNVDFMDSSGLAVIVRRHNKAEAAGQRFAVAASTTDAPAVRRLLELAGLIPVVDIVDDPAERLGRP